MRVLALVTTAVWGFTASGLHAQATADDELRNAIAALHHARAVSPAESQAAFARILSVDYVGIAPDGSFETRAEVVSRSVNRKERSIAIENERVHVFRDDTGRARTAIVTERARHEYASGLAYTQDLYVFRNDGNWLAIAGREMPVTPDNVLANPVNVNASSTSSHKHDTPNDRDLREAVHKWGWASVLSEPGSPEEEAKLAFINQTLVADTFGIAVDGSVGKEWDRRRGQRGVKSILYENVLIHLFGETGVVTYRSRYDYAQRTRYFLLVRIYMKRAGKWEMLSGQGFPVSQPTKN